MVIKTFEEWVGQNEPQSKGWSSKTGGYDVDLDTDVIGHQYHKFSSAWLDEATWDPTTNTLKVRFNNGFVAVRDCGRKRWNDLINASSAGSFWRRSEFY